MIIPRSIRSITILALVWTGIAAPDASAQRARVPAALDMSRDTTVARMVIGAVFGQLGHSIARATLDGKSQPWVLELPPENAAIWSQFREHFFKVVRGRPLSHPHEAHQVLGIGAIQLRGDSLIGEFSIAYAEYCGKGWMSDGYGYEMHTKRHATAYESPKTRMRSHWSGGCPRPGGTRHPPSPIDTGSIDSLYRNARVRVQASTLPEGWTFGEIVRYAGANRCSTVAVDKPRPLSLELEAITRLQVSTRWFGRPARGLSHVYSSGSETEGEQWREVDLRRILAHEAGCEP